MALQQELEKEGNWLFKYRSYLPIAMLGIGILIFYMSFRDYEWKSMLMEHWHIYEYLCLSVSILGVVIRIYTVGHTPANTSGRNTRCQIADELNTTGIYSTIRHPLYLGNFLMYFGIAMLVYNIWFTCIFILVNWLYYERIIYCEEQFLQRKFGHNYMEWALHTPTIIPNISNFKKPKYPFSWRKVLKKEKNGIFALFLIFTVFDGIAVYCLNLHQTTPICHINTPLLYLSVASGIGYMILKLIKKKTAILNEEGR